MLPIGEGSSLLLTRMSMRRKNCNFEYFVCLFHLLRTLGGENHRGFGFCEKEKITVFHRDSVLSSFIRYLVVK